MGEPIGDEDGYLDSGLGSFEDRHAQRQAYQQRDGSTVVSSDHGDQHSLSASSTAPLNRGGEPVSAPSASGLRERRRQPAISSEAPLADRRDEASDSDQLGRLAAAGMPIGLLAAMGTPYAKKPIFRSRKFKILCLFIVPIALIIATLILVLPVLRAIAKHVLNTTVFHIYASNITSPGDLSFGLTLDGQATKAGIFPAKVFFRRSVDVYWVNPDNMTEVQLGSFPLAPVGVAAGHGKLNQMTNFVIGDRPGFGRFAEYLITQSEFTWRLKAPVDAVAFSFISANGLELVKDLTLPAMANFTDIGISDFQLPGNDPAGGVTLDTVTRLTNPSPFGIEIGTLAASLYYKGMYLGPAVTSRYINLTQGQNVIPLTGRLVDQTGNQTALDLLSEVFSAYLNGDSVPVVAIGQYAELPDGTRVDWLNQGIRALQLKVPLRCPTGRISPIKSITIGTFGLTFDPSGSQSYAPIAASNTTTASFGLPFGFTLNISAVAVDMGIVVNDSIVANLSTPYGDSQTFVLDQNAGFESGTIDITIPPSALIVPGDYDSHLAFSQFEFDLTHGNGSGLYLLGVTNAITSTPIGEVELKDIQFVVPSGLVGLSRLLTAPTLILSVDVVGGTPDAIILSIVVGLTNPSNLILDVGDVTFQLFDMQDGSFLGTTVLPSLHLSVGYQTHTSTGYFQANNNPTALDTLNKFAQGIDSQLAISGFNGSTPQESLTQAFMDLQLNATLHGLSTKLLNYANVTVLPTTGVTDNVANTLVSLQNPFTSPLAISNIQSNITSRGLYTGAINQDTDFNAVGKTASISPTLGFGLDLYPPDIFSLLRQLVVDSGMDPAPLDGVVQLGGYQYVPTTPGPSPQRKRGLLEGDTGIMWGVDEDDEVMLPAKGMVAPGPGIADALYFGAGTTAPVLAKRQSASLYHGFDLPTYVLQAFKALTVNVDLTSVVTIGEFKTQLTYQQADVPAYTDSSLVLLLPILARPIVQKIVDGAVLAIDTVTIVDPQLNSFGTQLVGSITQAGPFDAVIAFLEGLTIYWNGDALGSIAMPNVSLVGDVGAQLNLMAAFSVADVGRLTNFTAYLVNTPQFTWTIEGANLAVSALGIIVTEVSISKRVVLAGMNGLKGDVTITHFDLPANDPAGGIHLVTDTTINNPSSVGVELATLSFNAIFGVTTLGPIAAPAPFTLAPKSQIQQTLVGRLVPQSSDQGLQDVSTVFTGFIHGVPVELTVAGTSAGPPGVSWLDVGIQALKVPVVFPAAANLQVILSISIYQLTLMFTEATAWDPAFSTDNTVAAFQLPFAFPLDIQQLAAQITTVDQNQGFALLNIPMGPSKTDVVARTSVLTFQNVPFSVFSGTHQLFSQFLTDTTDDPSKTFGLQGSADSIANTAVGNLNINGIGFSVSTTIAGLQGLNAQPAFVTDLDVYHGYPDYLQINVNAHLFNPSNITIGTGDVSFALQFDGQQIGTAFIPGLVLVPGANVIATQVRYSPQGGSEVTAGQTLLQNFVSGVVSQTIIAGEDNTTPIASLQQALASLRLGAAIPPLMQNLITQATLVFPTNIIQTGVANANFLLVDPFTASINLLGVIATAIYPSGSTPASKRVKRFGGPLPTTPAGLNLGQINVPDINPVITAPGHSQVTSYFLPLNFNLDPKVIIQLLEAQASKNGVDLGPLPPLFAYVLGLSDSQISGLRTQIPTQVLADQTSSGNAPQCVSGGQFDVFDAILNALKNLEVALNIQSVTKLDDYQTNLNINQFNVAAITDRTALYLIGAVAPPIVQDLVNQATLTVQNANITGVTDGGFKAALQGSLLDTGPFDAYIEFVQGVDVYFMGSKIANIALPPICSPANVAVPNLQTTGTLTVTDLGAFTNFATYILHNPSFDWLLQTNALRVSALGTQFDGVLLQKTISFQAFNGLPGTVLVNFDLPGDAPNNAGINIRTNALIPSPATLGIELGTANFMASFMGNEVGPIAAQNLFLALLSTTDATITGLFVPQSGDGIRTTGILFSEFLQGVTQTLQATGVSVISPAQPDRPVNWLTAAFKTLTIDVILPGKIYTIITSIQLANLQVMVVTPPQAYAVDSSSTEADAVYQNPFTFSLQAVQAGLVSTINFRGVDTAELDLPLEVASIAGVSTGQPAPLRIAFQNQTLRALNDGSFNDFFAQVFDATLAQFVLHGSANVIAATKIGQIEITGIPFSVNTNLPGVNAFGGTGLIPKPPIVVGSGGGGVNSFAEDFGADFIRLTIIFVVNNPSQLSVTSNFISFQVLYNGVQVGRATVNPLDLVPGQNSLSGEFHYAPTDPNQSDLVTQYLQRPAYAEGPSDPIPITVTGDAESSPYPSFIEALEGIKLSATFPGIGAHLVNYIHIIIDLVQALCNNTIDVQVKIDNALQADIFLNEMDAKADQPRGNQYASVTSQVLQPTPFRAPAGSVSGYSQPIPNFFLTKHLPGSLPLLLKLDGLYLTTVISASIQQANGYTIPTLNYDQDNVPYDYTINVGGVDIGQALTDPFGSITALVNGIIQDTYTCTLDGISINSTCNALTAILPAISPLCSSLGLLDEIVCTLVQDATQVIDPILGGILSILPIPGATSLVLPTSRASCTSTTTVTSVVSTSTGSSSSAANVAASATSVVGSVVCNNGLLTLPVGGICPTTTTSDTTTSSSSSSSSTTTPAAGGGILPSLRRRNDGADAPAATPAQDVGERATASTARPTSPPRVAGGDL